MAQEFSHQPVMLQSCIEGLDIKEDGIYVDGTLGGGGHSKEILKRLRTGTLISFDRDEEAIAAAKEKLKGFGGRFTAVKANFADMGAVLTQMGIFQVQGILLDIGVSSHQLDTPGRGFSYHSEAPLDMRMSRTDSLTAADIVNSYPEAELKRILYHYGEERFAGRIAKRICSSRQKKTIKTTFELNEIIDAAMPPGGKRAQIHPSRRTFQALRIAVNGELEALERALRTGVGLLAPGGRFAVITFHSLEDRIVKTGFASYAKGCACPDDFPVCICGKKPVLKLITRKPLEASEKEVQENPRSRSAKLRIAEKESE